MFCFFFVVVVVAFYSVLRPFQDYFSSYKKGQSVSGTTRGPLVLKTLT